MLISSFIYPLYALSALNKDTSAPLDISLPSLNPSFEVPIVIKTPGIYIPCVVVKPGKSEERIKCLIQFNQEACLEKLSPLSFDWKLSDTHKAVAQGRYGNRDDYFQPFQSMPNDKKHALGCEFAWLQNLQAGRYMLVLTNLHVPKELYETQPRLRLDIHSNPHESLNYLYGIIASILVGVVALLLFIIDFILRRVKNKSA
jgi:hypothetical protein